MIRTRPRWTRVLTPHSWGLLLMTLATAAVVAIVLVAPR